MSESINLPEPSFMLDGGTLHCYTAEYVRQIVLADRKETRAKALEEAQADRDFVRQCLDAIADALEGNNVHTAQAIVRTAIEHHDSAIRALIGKEPVVIQTPEKMENNGEREIIEVYKKLHASKIGAHWLWCVIEQIANGVSEVDAMAEYGYYEKRGEG